tara:strand:- start:545 stop:748 length:204 start_codon:yes stop_codon:yes gene_type:complete
MKIDEVKATVKEIETLGDRDPEKSHSMEDGLHLNILAYIADGGFGDLSELCVEALRIQDMDLTRWYA